MGLGLSQATDYFCPTHYQMLVVMEERRHLLISLRKICGNVLLPIAKVMDIMGKIRSRLG